ncbi:hypothetical protein [Silvibacterium dinghuense]|uniref:Uncharacterized protein n=1 Tax=Silvibacterium dinghuense TaxID=1560006 RepID=A0A4Q1S975_9BACT|nr:hypothetical protein [Silvibacterium dinghuense]RXS93433.1 hypothetical protein ESZ00_19005 [Silvibacterium dinghuense]GGH05759.1 hypothetical protein GCM10011586_22450 [Silvibacterium dinghuense]
MKHNPPYLKPSATKRTPIALLLSLLFLLLPGPLVAQGPSVEKTAPAAPQKPGEEGIKVHGHWKFVVKNPDGSIASTKEFENALLTPGSGDSLLSYTLSGQAVIGEWAVVLCNAANSGMFPASSPSSPWCGWNYSGAANSYWDGLIVTSMSGYFGTVICPNSPVCDAGLTLTTPTPSGSKYPTQLVLSGNYTNSGTQPVTVYGVQTVFVSCFASIGAASTTATVSPSQCQNQGSLPSLTGVLALPFTGTTVTQAVAAGQVLSITVTLSFS